MTNRDANLARNASTTARLFQQANRIVRRSLRHNLILVIVALLVIWLAVSLPRLHGPIDLRWDASTYYILGTRARGGERAIGCLMNPETSKLCNTRRYFRQS